MSLGPMTMSSAPAFSAPPPTTSLLPGQLPSSSEPNNCSAEAEGNSGGQDLIVLSLVAGSAAAGSLVAYWALNDKKRKRPSSVQSRLPSIATAPPIGSVSPVRANKPSYVPSVPSPAPSSSSTEDFQTDKDALKCILWRFLRWLPSIPPSEYRKDPELAKAAEDFVKAEHAGIPEASFVLAFMELYGYCGEENTTKASRFLAAAAEAGISEATNNLGVLHAKGIDGVVNYEEASRLFAESGTPAAKDNLMIMNTQHLDEHSLKELKLEWAMPHLP